MKNSICQCNECNPEVKNENRFFVYEGDILRAAQSSFTGAMRFFKEGRKLMHGKPYNHSRDLTNIATKLTTWTYANN